MCVLRGQKHSPNVCFDTCPHWVTHQSTSSESKNPSAKVIDCSSCGISCVYANRQLLFSRVSQSLLLQLCFKLVPSLCFTYTQLFILKHRVSITYRILSFSLSDELGRVRLRFGPKQGSDYINASFIDVRNKQQHMQALLMYAINNNTCKFY